MKNRTHIHLIYNYIIYLPAECGHHTINIYSLKSADFNLFTLTNALSYLFS